MKKSKISSRNVTSIPKSLTKDWNKPAWVYWEKLPDGGITVRPMRDVTQMFGMLERNTNPKPPIS